MYLCVSCCICIYYTQILSFCKVSYIVYFIIYRVLLSVGTSFSLALYTLYVGYLVRVLMERI